MRRSILLVIAAGCLSAAGPAAEGVTKELAKFRGTWKYTSLEQDGRPVPEAQYREARLTIKGDQFTFTLGADTSHGTFEVDPAQKPKAIDVTFTDGPDKGKTIRGVYELTGDTYKACLGSKENDRPKELASKAGTGHVLAVLKRVQP